MQIASMVFHPTFNNILFKDEYKVQRHYMRY